MNANKGRRVSRAIKEAAVTAFISSGNIKKVAGDYGISQETLRIAHKNYITSGDVISQVPRLKPGMKVKIDELSKIAISELMAVHPTIYLRELRTRLYAEMGLEVHKSTLCRYLQATKSTRKRVSRKAAQRSEALRNAYIQEIAAFSPEQLVFCDESAISESSTQRRWGWAKRGHKVVVETDYTRLQRHSLLPLLGYNGYLTLDIIQDSYNEERFEEWIVNSALPVMNAFPLPHSVLVMDNAPIHNEEVMKALCTEHGVVLKMLPPYSPDLNPIENSFGLLKRWLQAHYEDSASAELQEAVRHAARASMTPEVVHALYRGCGYFHCDEEARRRADDNWAELARVQSL